MKHQKSFRTSSIYITLTIILLTACNASPIATAPPTSNSEVETHSPTLTATQTPPQTQTEVPKADIWKIQMCHKAPSIVPSEDYGWIMEYIGDMEGHGEINMLLNFTETNEILGFAFDFEQVREYRINGCVDERAFTMWLQQGNTVERVIRGEFPKTDPRGNFSSSNPLGVEVITGSLIEKSKSGSLSLYLLSTSSTSGTMQHRFQLAGVKDDAVILDASKQFLSAIAQDDRSRVIAMLHFPVEFRKETEDLKEIQTPGSFLAQYDDIFDTDFRGRLAITFPNYLMADAGNFVGSIDQSIYGGGALIFDEYGKVIAIYNWKAPVSTPTVTSNSNP